MQDRAPLPPGENAFPAIWLLNYEVPREQLQAVAEADIAQSSETVTPAGDGLVVESQRAALTGFEQQRPSREDAQLFCNGGDIDCLARVRADLGAYEGLIARHRGLLDRVAALQDYGYYRSPPSAPSHAMLPPLQPAGYELTRVAWQFANGDVDGALAGACNGVQTWRRLGANSDAPLIRRVADAYTDRYIRLLAGMLGEVGPTHELPTSCATAFAAPTVADASLCEAMRGEFVVSTHHIRELAVDSSTAPSRIPNLLPALTWDPEKSLAILADGHSWACSDATANNLVSDVRVDPGQNRQSLWRLECVANPTGCILADIAFPAYYNYQWKAQDHAARLELMGALLWLRSNARTDEPLEPQLTAYWQQHRRGNRELRLEDDGRTVKLQMYADGPDTWWSLPFFPAAE
ncbi:hypothetical protein INQ41_03755 [Lysobacter ciconiae]|uniref:Uncharacterized protein n=1 Tax=Novilysobacter ciconiae TaxID=2781022 RepID=A0A7S6UH46_9GAMM|nr:hypothetical protein [Lysobacter ciconiae]QOW20161.1 hypothetical protein INQ41_03755 [Lysobacter ciconiae]